MAAGSASFAVPRRAGLQASRAIPAAGNTSLPRRPAPRHSSTTAGVREDDARWPAAGGGADAAAGGGTAAGRVFAAPPVSGRAALGRPSSPLPRQVRSTAPPHSPGPMCFYIGDSSTPASRADAAPVASGGSLAPASGVYIGYGSAPAPKTAQARSPSGQGGAVFIGYGPPPPPREPKDEMRSARSVPPPPPPRTAAAPRPPPEPPTVPLMASDSESDTESDSSPLIEIGVFEVGNEPPPPPPPPTGCSTWPEPPPPPALPGEHGAAEGSNIRAVFLPAQSIHVSQEAPQGAGPAPGIEWC